MIIDRVEKIDNKYFRFLIYLSNTDKYYFGHKKIKTYIDGATNEEKERHWDKQMKHPLHSLFITYFLPSTEFFNSYLLWGEYRTLKENIIHLNSMLIKIGY